MQYTSQLAMHKESYNPVISANQIQLGHLTLDEFMDTLLINKSIITYDNQLLAVKISDELLKLTVINSKIYFKAKIYFNRF